MYNYETEKPRLFTDDGQRMFLSIRDNSKRLLAVAGCFRSSDCLSNVTGDSWQMLACLDRLVELGEIKRISPSGTPGQHEIFIQA